MKQVNIKMTDSVRDAINQLFYIMPPKNRGSSINLFMTDLVDTRVSSIASKFSESTGKRGAPKRSKSKVVEAILEAFAASHQAGKFGSKDLAKVYEISKSICKDLQEESINIGLTKSVFCSGLLQYLCKTQKMSDKLFQNLYKD